MPRRQWGWTRRRSDDCTPWGHRIPLTIEASRRPNPTRPRCVITGATMATHIASQGCRSELPKVLWLFPIPPYLTFAWRNNRLRVVPRKPRSQWGTRNRWNRNIRQVLDWQWWSYSYLSDGPHERFRACPNQRLPRSSGEPFTPVIYSTGTPTKPRTRELPLGRRNWHAHIEAFRGLRSTLYTINVTKATGRNRDWRLQPSTQLSILLDHLHQ